MLCQPLIVQFTWENFLLFHIHALCLVSEITALQQMVLMQPNNIEGNWIALKFLAIGSITKTSLVLKFNIWFILRHLSRISCEVHSSQISVPFLLSLHAWLHHWQQNCMPNTVPVIGSVHKKTQCTFWFCWIHCNHSTQSLTSTWTRPSVSQIYLSWVNPI